MKNTLLIALIIAWFQFTNAQETITIDWKDSFSKAQKMAKKQNKKILLFFTGSDWCSPCKSLEEDVLQTDRFKKLTKNTILYKADFPRAIDLVSKKQKKENSTLKEKYHISSYPVIIIIDKHGHVIAEKKSYNLMRDPSYHFAFLEENLE